jgi:hypothetical protein
MRFLALVVALVALCMSSMQVDAALNVADLDSTLVSVAKATAKSIPRANSELVKLLTAYEKSPSRSTASFLDTQGENVAAKTAALAEKLNAAITAVSDVLGIVAPDEDFDEAKKGVVRASVACPRALTVLGHLIDAVPFAALTKDDGGQLLRAVHLLGYTVTHTLNDYSCRAHINLLEFVQKTDRALTRYVDSIDTATSDVALVRAFSHSIALFSLTLSFSPGLTPLSFSPPVRTRLLCGLTCANTLSLISPPSTTKPPAPPPPVPSTA